MGGSPSYEETITDNELMKSLNYMISFWVMLAFTDFFNLSVKAAPFGTSIDSASVPGTVSSPENRYKKGKKDSNIVQNEILVKFKPATGKTDIDSVISSIGAKILKYISLIQVYHLRLTKNMSTKEAIERLQENPSVEYAEPNYVQHIDNFKK